MKATRLETDLYRLRFSKQFLIVLVLLLVSLMIWTFISIAASQNKTTLSKELVTLAAPLNPSVDREVFATLQGKRFFSEAELTRFTIYRLLTAPDGRSQTAVPIDMPVIRATPTPQPTIIPTPEPTPIDASPSSTLN